MTPSVDWKRTLRHQESVITRQAAVIARFVLTLTEIADADYRGNRSHESVIAHNALVAEGFRQTTDRKESL